jgi:YbbR domain-containing protein
MKINSRKLLNNGKFLIIISVVISILIWVGMSLGSDNESTTIVSNIPIQINLSDDAVKDGLQIFSGEDQTASVTVTGNRVALGSLNSDDISVSALSASTITSPGTYPLSLTAKKSDATTGNFEISSSVSPSVITIFVDRSKKVSFDVENKIKYSVAEGYHAEVTLSASSVKIEGPQTEISKIASVAVEGEISGELTKDAEIQSDVKLYDNTGSEITSSMISVSEDNILVNINVSPEKKVPLKVAFENKPSGLNMDSYVSIEPKSILVSGPQDILDKLDAVYTEKIDFTKLSDKKSTYELDIDLSEKCMNLSEIKTATVKIDLSDFTNKKVKTSKISVVGTNNDYNYNVTTDSLTITVMGKKSDISDIKSSDISCQVDASKIDGTTGSISMPVTVKISGNDNCWAYGEYKANVTVTNK